MRSLRQKDAIGIWSSIAISSIILSLAVTVHAQALPPVAAPAPSAIATSNSTGFITVQGTKFQDGNCRDFAFVGGNAWFTLEAAAGTLPINSVEYLGGRNLSQYLFDTAMASNISVIRFIGGSANDADDFKLQTAPGVYNEVAFQALDRLIADAGQRGIKLIITMTDNWHLQDGLQQYVNWAKETSNNVTGTADFFSNPAVINIFKDHIKAIVTRKNTINGLQYKDDPTIFAWDLLNELRDGCDQSKPNVTCTPAFTGTVQSWIEETSAYLKSLDTNHLVTVGEEGFYGPGSGNTDSNPSPGDSAWCAVTGQNFTANHAPNTIDFTAVHLWPDNWEVNGTSGKDPVAFAKSWLSAHEKSSQQLGKPFVVEEFGKNVYDRSAANIAKTRDPVFAAVYDALADSLKSNGVFRGAAFWEYSFIAGPPDENQVLYNESTWTNIIEPAASNAAAYVLSTPAMANCNAGASSSANASVATAGRR